MKKAGEKQKNKRTEHSGDSARPVDVTSEPSPAFTVDFEEFAHFFEDEDMSEDEARAFLKLYWEIACELMSLGFGFHPAQQAQKACGKTTKTPGAPPVSATDRVHLTEHFISDNFEQAADPKPGQAGKESRHDAV